MKDAKSEKVLFIFAEQFRRLPFLGQIFPAAKRPSFARGNGCAGHTHVAEHLSGRQTGWYD
jgi:hypothetical protein